MPPIEKEKISDGQEHEHARVAHRSGNMKRAACLAVAVLALSSCAPATPSVDASPTPVTLTILVDSPDASIGAASVRVTVGEAHAQGEMLSLPVTAADGSEGLRVTSANPVSVIAETRDRVGTVRCRIVDSAGRVLAENSAGPPYAGAFCRYG